MSVIERLRSSPDRGPFAVPRPDMRGPYLIRNPRVAAAFAAMDAVLSLVPVRRPPVPAQPERILLANWGHLGDVTTTMGAVRLLRERCPRARIGMIIGSWGKAAAEGSGLLDAVHIVDHPRLNRTAASAAEKRAAYRRTRAVALHEIGAADYQVGIDFYPFYPPAHPLFYRAGIPVRVGFTSGGWGPLLTHPVRWPDCARPIADHYAGLIEAAWPEMPVPVGAMKPRADRARLAPLPAEIAGVGPFLVIHPGSGAVPREWGEEHWAGLIALLRADPDLGSRRVVLTGAGARDAATVEQLAAGAPDIINMANRANWGEFNAMLAHADVVVCPDTVTSHLAALHDTPLVTVFTGTVKAEQWGPYSDRARVLMQDVVCAPCNRSGCDTMACIRRTRPSDVLRAIRVQLGLDRVDEA